MIDSSLLLDDLRKLLRVLESDLRERCQTEDAINAPVSSEYQAARKSGRTVEAFESWREEYLTQVGVAWLLGCVFVRFLEDNGLIDPMISGPGDRMGLARDARDSYFKQHQLESDRDYLVSAFRKIEKLPAGAQLFDERHNPLWRVPISGDAASKVLDLWRTVDPESGELVHDFSDPNWDTRFLGDLYQDLSEEARSKYALLQTPVFVEEFILDRTLTPAIDEFGFNEVRLIDPTCGSGHFLLGAFARLLALWQRYEPGTNVRALAQRALDQVYGVDLNPYATAIARFRLLLTALRASEVARLNQAPNFKINVATGDSLLHGRRFTGDYTLQQPLPSSPYRHLYEAEDGPSLERILGQQYHAVVGNPPYITVKDRALNQIYRDRYPSCYRGFSLVVPFLERFFDLAIPGRERTSAGFVGMIVSNAFMKREFGKRLIEQFIPQWDLAYVIDTSGAYIPGHGTPTAILFGRNREPALSTVRAVMGIRGEPSTPDDPAKGKVWTEILSRVDDPGFIGEFVSVSDTSRETLNRHPWSLGGGGAAELKVRLDGQAEKTLGRLCTEIGFAAVTREDDAYLIGENVGLRKGIPAAQLRALLAGEDIRDWGVHEPTVAIWPYDPGDLKPAAPESVVRFLWLWRRQLCDRVAYGLSQIARGLQWFEYSMFFRERFRTPKSIAFAAVATHNHFVFDRGGKVFKQSAPVIKLSPAATEDDHLALVGLLNCSTACFWMKQVFYPKGGDHVGQRGARVRKTLWDERYDFDGTKAQQFPITAEKPLELAKLMDFLARHLCRLTPGEIARREVPDYARLARAQKDYEATRFQMIALQEELDWESYRLYGLINDSLTMPGCDAPEINLGERAFEIVMAGRMVAGELQTAWFERHGSTPISEIPEHWPVAYRKLVERRIEMIGADPNIGLIEKPEYKRRWNTEPWDQQLERALRTWLLDRLESKEHWPRVELTSCARLAERAANDSDFMQVAQLYRSRPDFDLTELVVELVESASVPHSPDQRYKESGLRKRELWERTWEMQRKEDEIDSHTRLPERDSKRLTQEQADDLKVHEVGDIPVPPKYKSADFIKNSFWSLRGPLDVPKERFISYPKCERRGDPTRVIGWAGWNHLQQAQALAEWYDGARKEGWSPDQLKPMLAGLMELLPWLKQWYNQLNPEYGLKMADFFSDYLDQQLLALDFSREDLRRL